MNNEADKKDNESTCMRIFKALLSVLMFFAMIKYVMTGSTSSDGLKKTAKG